MLHGTCLSRRSFCSVWRKKNVLNDLWAAPLLVLYRIITECFFGYDGQVATIRLACYSITVTP